MIRCRPLFLVAIAIAALTAAAPSRAEEPPYPEPSGFVVDQANLLRPETIQHLTEVCQELRDKTGVELAVALVPSIAPLEIEDYAVELFKRWGVGKKKEDNGVLFVLAHKERRVRIEVGYGLEGLLPDGRVGGILRTQVVPALRRDDWDAGVTGGVEALAAIIAQDRSVELATLHGRNAPPPENSGSESSPIQPWVVFLTVFAVLTLVSIARPMSSRRGMRGRRGGYWGGPGSFGGFGGFGGGGGGGFGGFGGGSSGGGGASSGF